MFTPSAIIMTVNLRSDRTSSLTCAVLSPRRVVDGRPLRYSSSIRVLPSETFCASERLVLLTLHHLKRAAEVLHVLWWQ